MSISKKNTSKQTGTKKASVQPAQMPIFVNDGETFTQAKGAIIHKLLEIDDTKTPIDNIGKILSKHTNDPNIYDKMNVIQTFFSENAPNQFVYNKVVRYILLLF